MLTSFTIADVPFHVYLTEAEAAEKGDLLSAFVLSMEDIHHGLHCDNMECINCPFVTECDTYTKDLPYHLITTYTPELVSQYPEYFI